MQHGIQTDMHMAFGRLLNLYAKKFNDLGGNQMYLQAQSICAISQTASNLNMMIEPNMDMHDMLTCVAHNTSTCQEFEKYVAKVS